MIIENNWLSGRKIGPAPLVVNCLSIPEISKAIDLALDYWHINIQYCDLISIATSIQAGIL